MSMQEKLKVLEEIMDLEEGTLKEDTVLEEIEEWDSLSKLSLIAIAKKQFNLVLNTQKLKEFVTVSDICDFLN